MIDEKKLIERFEHTPALSKIAHNLVRIVEEQPKIGEWISVSERLPESDGFYLATLDGAIVGEDRPFTGLAEFEDGKWIDDEEDYKCVIAWQPLPEPYSQDK